MADFKTHLIGAAAVSGIAATGLMLVGVVPQNAVPGYFVLGIVGGLLPDIDSDTSIPLRIAFSVLAIVAAFLLIFSIGQRYSLLELTLLWLACFASVRFGVFNLFTRVTVHRGLIHSIPAGALFGLFTVLLAYRSFGAAPLQAWLCGSFVFLGFLIHLLLDEIYSVNLTGMQIKRSFGSAFNLGSIDNPYGTLALYLAIVGLCYLSPPADTFVGMVLDGNLYRDVLHRLLPAHGWFRGLL